MALKHEFNRPGEVDEANPILRLDARLTHLADRGAKGWQARTPVSRQTLTFGLYVAAALLGVGYVLLTREVLFLGIVILAYAGSLPGKQRGSLVEEIQIEATGLPRHTMKYLSVGLLLLGLFGIVTSLPVLLISLAFGGTALGELAGLVGGLSLTTLKAADYIARTNPSNRGDRERQIERVRSRVTVGAGA